MPSNSIILFLENNVKRNVLNVHNLYYIFKTMKKKKYNSKKKKGNLISLCKFHKILLNLMIDKYSYLHSYLSRNKYISIFHLFKFAICEVAYQNIQKFIIKYKGIKKVYSEITSMNNYVFILKIYDNKHIFKILGKQKKKIK